MPSTPCSRHSTGSKRVPGETAYLAGDQITEADWRLFTTLVRYPTPSMSDTSKCNRQRIADYRNLSHYLKALYEVPGVKETVHIDHIKTHLLLEPHLDKSNPDHSGRGRSWSS